MKGPGRASTRPRAGADGRQSQAKIDALLRELRGKDGLARQRARRTLTKIGRPVVPRLVALLYGSRRDVRWEAAKALSEIADPSAAPALIDALEDEDFGVRWLGAQGLIAMGRGAVVPVLRALDARSNSVWLREGAHHVLHDIARANRGLASLLAGVVSSLEGVDPQVAVLRPAFTALEKLRRNG